MRVVNAMFGRNLGGIEQSFLDYCVGLKEQSCQVVALTHPAAKINEKLKQHGIHNIQVGNFGQYDFIASLKIRKIFKEIKPDVVITHGNRPFSLINRVKGKIPVVAVTHNYNIRRYIKADAIFAISEDLKREMQKRGHGKVYKIPNMVKLEKKEKYEFHDWKKTPVIGIMSRFVKKKGIDVFLESMAILKSQGVNFHAVIAGAGEEENNLRTLAKKLGLEENASFPGWVEDKRSFFSSLDFFVLPSLHEPFGIVLLEAFSCHVPVITTDSEGPSEIAEHGQDAIIVQKGNPEMLAAAIAQIISDRDMTLGLAENAYNKVKENYTMEVVSKKIIAALQEIV